MNAVLSEKGQITIPKAVREKLGLLPGVVLEFAAENGRLVGRKKVSEDAFKKWRGRGRLPKDLSVDDYLRLTRDAHGS
jgi:AbrB family looped-hinge helix DNA binding protein